MRTHIDWITFTLPMWYADRENDTYAESIEYAFVSTFDAKTLATAFGGQWEIQERSRAPYTHAWTMPEAGITLFASQSLNHATVEISGHGCERLITKGVISEVISPVIQRITRIDIAADIETEITPSAFTDVLSHKRMRASGYQKSATGETCYIGSQNSDRYARVYRYVKPHPRAHLLRVECVYRKKYAQAVAREAVENGLEAVVRAGGKAFGFMHTVWNTDGAQEVDISIISPSRSAGNTVHWLITACAPAFRRLVESGDIRDPEAFIRDYFMQK